MHNIIFPSKDTTIYSKYPEINTGLDEILEITKEVSSSLYNYRGTWLSSSYYRRYDYIVSSSEYFFAVAENINEQPSQSSYWVGFDPTSINENSRILLQFDLNNFEPEATASASAVYLNLFTSIARRVPVEYTLQAYPISGAWEMGVGNFTDKLTTGGATWTRRNTTTEWNSQGGEYYANYSASQDFNFSPTDIRMNVTDIFNYWIASSSNYGFIIKRTDVQEQDNVKYGSLSFYSLDTHTVYLPTLEILYDDQVYNSSSFIASGSSLSASFSSSIIEENLIDISGSYIYYYSASVTESNVSIVANGTLPSSSLVYGTGSITINTVLSTPSSSVSESVLTYTSASVIETIINVVSGSTYVSGAIEYTPFTASFSTLLYSTGSYVSSSVIYTAVSSSSDYSGSLLTGSVGISMKNFKPEYEYNTKARFYITAKPSYVAKTFYEEWRIGEVYYLPDTFYYSIRDAYNNRVMVPFSDYTKISLDEKGHYFDVSLSGFMPERFYDISFKVIMNGETQYIKPKSQFKVVK